MREAIEFHIEGMRLHGEEVLRLRRENAQLRKANYLTTFGSSSSAP
jgi:hypothetical protein